MTGLHRLHHQAGWPRAVRGVVTIGRAAVAGHRAGLNSFRTEVVTTPRRTSGRRRGGGAVTDARASVASPAGGPSPDHGRSPASGPETDAGQLVNAFVEDDSQPVDGLQQGLVPIRGAESQPCEANGPPSRHVYAPSRGWGHVISAASIAPRSDPRRRSGSRWPRRDIADPDAPGQARRPRPLEELRGPARFRWSTAATRLPRGDSLR